MFEDSELRRLEFDNSLKELAEGLPMMLSFISNQAKLVRGYYVELIKQGFTESQAIDIVKIHGYNPPVNGPKQEDS